jgi:putative transposase
MVSAHQRRQQVEYARRRGLSCRRSCALLQIARSSLRYESKKVKEEGPVRQRMRALAAQYPRYGYRRIRVFLAREGHKMSADRAHRLWRTERLQLPRRRPRRRIAASRPRPLPASGPNQVWAYDFVFDFCANGQKVKCLTIIDEWTHEALAIDVAGSIRSGRVIERLAELVSMHGAPKYLRSDNGPEFVATAVLRWLTDEGIETAHIAPGKPWQNGIDESFNGRFRDECLSMEYFRNRAEATAVIEAWRRHYNEVRPHSSLGYLTPTEFKKKVISTSTETREALLQ